MQKAFADHIYIINYTATEWSLHLFPSGSIVNDTQAFLASYIWFLLNEHIHIAVYLDTCHLFKMQEMNQNDMLHLMYTVLDNTVTPI